MPPSFKSLLRRLLHRGGFEVAHRTSDGLLQETLRSYEYLRHASPESHEWEQHFNHLAMAAHLRQLLRDFKIDLVLDVGANQGQFGQLLRLLGYAGDIISFEPGPAAFARLQAVARQDAHWRVYPLALSSTDGELVLHVSEHDVFSSVHRANQTGQSFFGSMMEISHAVTVPKTRLDSFWAAEKQGKPRRVFLKSDTQGHDLEVLRGATNMLSHCLALQLESAYQLIYDQAPPHEVVTRYLMDCGFQPAGIFPISYAPANHALIEADHFFVRQLGSPAIVPSA